MIREFSAESADEMRELGAAIAARARAGDLIVLTGGLGAGKTTLTQGIGAGLGVRGGVVSPTFTISREYPSLTGGPALVHVDMYRLGGDGELDALDLDTSLDDSVTVVEWGEGLRERLSDDRLEVEIRRPVGGAPVGPAAGSAGSEDDDDLAGGTRIVTMTPVGPRWEAAIAAMAPRDAGQSPCLRDEG